MARSVVGVIGGSGLYGIEGLEKVREVEVKTPFGRPSEKFIKGRVGETEMVFLPRHGKGHRWLPTEVNFRANIFAMKQLGVERIISVSAVGSLRQEIEPGDIVIPDQFIDRTTQRPSTFFGKGIVAHVSLADPFCKDLSQILATAAISEGGKVHSRGHVSLYGRAAVFDAGRIPSLSQLGSACDWDDESAGGEARAGGGNLFRDSGVGHGL